MPPTPLQIWETTKNRLENSLENLKTAHESHGKRHAAAQGARNIGTGTDADVAARKADLDGAQQAMFDKQAELTQHNQNKPS